MIDLRQPLIQFFRALALYCANGIQQSLKLRKLEKAVVTSKHSDEPVLHNMPVGVSDGTVILNRYPERAQLTVPHRLRGHRLLTMLRNEISCFAQTRLLP